MIQSVVDTGQGFIGPAISSAPNGKALTTKTKMDLRPLIALATNGLQSERTVTSYKRSLENFLAWYDGQPIVGLTKEAVNAYKNYLIYDQDAGPGTVNIALSAIKKMAREAADNFYISAEAFASIRQIKGVKRSGVRTGDWLDLAEARALMHAPDPDSTIGRRDRAIICLLLGSGIRRLELTNLVFDDLQMREARWVLLDLVGKGGRIRTIPVPAWTKTAVDDWVSVAHGAGVDVTTGPLLRGVTKGGVVATKGLSPHAIWLIVRGHTESIGKRVALHCMRRTFARLSFAGGADLKRISQSLGHSSIAVTSLYLGDDQDLASSACDFLGL